jgi:hypothetical protein
LAKLVGSAGEPAGCTTVVVVTECVVELPPAITSAITPPATAPPMSGSISLRVFIR